MCTYVDSNHHEGLDIVYEGVYLTLCLLCIGHAHSQKLTKGISPLDRYNNNYSRKRGLFPLDAFVSLACQPAFCPALYNDSHVAYTRACVHYVQIN